MVRHARAELDDRSARPPQAGSGHTDLHFGSIDAKRGLVSVVYRYRGERPSEVVRVRGSVVEPRYVADVGLEYLGRRIVWQRYLWLPVETGFTVELGGVQAHIDLRANAGRSEDVDTGVLSTRAVAAAARAEPQATLRGLRRVRRRGGLMLREAKAILRERPSVLAAVRRADIAWRSMSRGLSREFAGAWVFIDRDVDANDSAEILYAGCSGNGPRSTRGSSSDGSPRTGPGSRRRGSASWLTALHDSPHS